jgi:anti-sigma factor RsiW
VTACKDFDLLLPLHAAGALDPAEAGRVEAHLAACAACRAEAARDAEALSLAKLPPPTEAERRALEGVPRRAAAALHRADRRRFGWKRVGAAIAVAAAALLAILAPGLLHNDPPAPPPQVALVQEAERWEVPDPETMWEEAGVLDLGASSTSDDDATDVALAALDL